MVAVVLKPRTSKYCKQTRLRIKVALAAYAYEILSQPIMSDGDYDRLAKRINPDKLTGNKVMDDFFRQHFKPHTGMWIHDHPEKSGLANILYRHFIQPPKRRSRKRARKLSAN